MGYCFSPMDRTIGGRPGRHRAEDLERCRICVTVEQGANEHSHCRHFAVGFIPMIAISEMLEHALALHRAGRLAEAEAGYRRVLEIRSRHPDALHLLGALALQVGQTEAAVKLIESAIAVSGKVAQYHGNLGEAKRRLGDLRGALVSYRRALKLDPMSIDTRRNLALLLVASGADAAAVIALQQVLRLDPACGEAHAQFGDWAFRTGNPATAVQCYSRTLICQPNHATAGANRAQALAILGRHDAALAEFRQVLTRFPALTEAHCNLGTLFGGLGDAERARIHLCHAVALGPDRAETWFSLGNQARSEGRYAEAARFYQRSVRIWPHWAEAACNRALALEDLGRHSDAAAILRHTLSLNPDFAVAWSNLGNVHRHLDQDDRAMSCYRRCLAILPNQVQALSNVATIYHDQGNVETAIAILDRALAIMPDSAEARHNRALSRLQKGDLAGGWLDFEARIAAPTVDSRFPAFDQPRWTGEDLAGRTILLHAEQGLGDTLQFLRYVPLVIARGGRIVLAVQPPLVSLLRNFPGIAELVVIGDVMPAFDCWLPLMSLPLIFATTLKTIPNEVPYLSANSGRRAVWRRRLGDGIRIGVVWAGSPLHGNDRNRSCPLTLLEPLLTAPGLRWFSLQKGPRAADLTLLGWQDRMVDLAPVIGDFADTAAIVADLDLVISVDTAVAHLAGALGRPCWLLLPFSSDWRWLRDRHDSPWYPTFRLFRQSRPGDWQAVIEQCREAVVGFR